MQQYSYDPIAKKYLAERGRLKSGKYVQKLLKLLPKHATILDVGCGAGVPVDDLLLKAGHTVLGIDNSSEQIRLARKRCPGGEYAVRDMRELRVGEYRVDAVVSFYALFHAPRGEHARILSIWRSYLPKGGYLLATFGDRDFEGEHTLYGATVWSSQWGRSKNRALVERAGFEVIMDEVDRSGGESHQVILAKAR